MAAVSRRVVEMLQHALSSVRILIAQVRVQLRCEDAQGPLVRIQLHGQTLAVINLTQGLLVRIQLHGQTLAVINLTPLLRLACGTNDQAH
ncbi:uncharacterized protein V6R79_023934 [Siganus canaliculatus]